MSTAKKYSVKKNGTGKRPGKSKKSVVLKILLYIVSIIIVMGGVILLFTVVYPTFGGVPSKEQQKTYEGFDNYQNGKFVNQPSTLAADSFPPLSNSATGDSRPANPLPVAEIDWTKISSPEDSLTWLGHSAFILSLDNNKILIDPMLGLRASPVSFVGPKRYSEDLLDMIEEMPPIDAVFITHDHYDHLDYESIKRLESKVAHFFVPYGVSSHLMEWGVGKDKITELNWWDETEFKGLTIALTPAKHFSGRGILNRNSTLWGGWVILGLHTRFYTSGDGGYDGHFQEIGDKYGPFDIALIEGGQYDERWKESHMRPEESVQASIEVKAKQMMLMHWGAFTLARHSWTDPIERATGAAKEKDVKLLAPQIGEIVPLDGSAPEPVSRWWD